MNDLSKTETEVGEPRGGLSCVKCGAPPDLEEDFEIKPGSTTFARLRYTFPCRNRSHGCRGVVEVAPKEMFHLCQAQELGKAAAVLMKLDRNTERLERRARGIGLDGKPMELDPDQLMAAERTLLANLEMRLKINGLLAPRAPSVHIDARQNIKAGEIYVSAGGLLDKAMDDALDADVIDAQVRKKVADSMPHPPPPPAPMDEGEAEAEGF